jgi:hypothetical protein
MGFTCDLPELYQVLLDTMVVDDSVRNSLRQALASYVGEGGVLLDKDCLQVCAQDLTLGGPQLAGVIDELFGQVVVKRVKSIGVGEYGYWMDSTGESRLERDYVVSDILHSRIQEGVDCLSEGDLDIFGLPVLRAVEPINYSQGVYLQKRVEGVPLLKYGDVSEEFALRLAGAVALLHSGLDRSSRLVVDYNKEFAHICGLLGFDLRFPFEFVYNGYVHNTLHPGQVLVNGGNFTFLDFELAGKGMRQDDFIRLFRGPLNFDVDDDLVIKFYYCFMNFSRVHLGRKTFEGLIQPTLSQVKGLENEDSFRKFMFNYHLRRVPMHMWAHHHLGRKEVPNDQLEQVVNATLEAEDYCGFFDRLKVKKFRKQFEKQVGKVI